MHWATRSLYSGAGQMPAQLLTAPSTPLSAVSNFAQMYDEDSSGMLASLKKVRFEEARQKGVAFKDAEAWWNALTEDQREEMEDEAGQKALVSAIPNAALETIADKVLIGKLPLPAKLQKAILVWRKSNPRLALGARVGASVLGKLLTEGSTETGQGLVSQSVHACKCANARTNRSRWLPQNTFRRAAAPVSQGPQHFDIAFAREEGLQDALGASPSLVFGAFAKGPKGPVNRRKESVSLISRKVA